MLSRAVRPASRQSTWRAMAAAIRAAEKGLVEGASPKHIIRAATKAARRICQEVQARRTRAKVARSRRKPSSKKASETSGLQADAQSLATRAATCREAWDATGAVKVIQEAAKRMELEPPT
ncbi:unnamed protein product, partial [Cladocopium goreaui]